MAGPDDKKEAAPPDSSDAPEPARLSPEEEAALMLESHAIKAEANALFSARDYHNALARYEDAIESCPRHRRYERAVLQSNAAAAHLQLEQWEEAIKAATAALDGLAELDAEGQDAPAGEADGGAGEPATGGPAPGGGGDATTGAALPETADEEIVSGGALRSAPAPPPETAPPSPAEARKADVLRIRTKALLRRARARSEAGGWQNLAGAEEDYRALAAMPGLAPADTRTVRAQLRALPPRTKAAQESEMAEMWGKLRHLGDGILRPFGLSTQNFQMVKDEKTGGYSLNFNQGGGAPSSSSPS